MKDYLLQLFEKGNSTVKEEKIKSLLTQATLPKVGNTPFNWKDIILAGGLEKEYLLKNGKFIEQRENLIFYGGVGTGKPFYQHSLD